MPLTMEERERRAYADGDVQTAELLREAIDGGMNREEYWRGWDDGHAEGLAGDDE